MERFVVNVEAVLVRNDRYLMTVRSERETHAPGTLSAPGGVVEWTGLEQDVLEATAVRELEEEVGMRVTGPFVYVKSNAFVNDEEMRVVDVVLMAPAGDGEATANQPEEIAAVRWMTAAEVATDPLAPPWTRETIRRAEERRLALGW